MSNNRFNIIFAFIITMFLSTNQCFSESEPDQEEESCTKSHHKQTEVSGVFRFQITPVECDTAWSFLGELGPDNYRANLTYAKEYLNCLRYKLSGEYLAQRHHYKFTNTSDKEWVNQIAIGGEGQCVMNYCGVASIEVGGDYSYAFGKKLSRIECDNTLYRRKIAGSNAYNVRGGATFNAFSTGLFSLWLDYDSVTYLREFRNKKNIIGYGAGFLLDQPVSDCFVVNVLGDIKKPYQYYELQVNWEGEGCGGCWEVGAFSSYTHGRYGLCSDVKIGGLISYTYGPPKQTRRTRRCDIPCVDARNSFKKWVTTPAVYRPVVLAISDQQVCSAPTFIGTPPTQINLFQSLEMTPVDFSQFITGTNLIYSITNLPNGLSLDSVTGILSGTPTQSGNFNATLTVTNACDTITYDVLISVIGRV